MQSKVTEVDLSEQRILSAIVFTDGVAFSARMAENEENTLRLIRRDLNLMRKVCASFEGQVLKSTGDGLLMSFNSALKAIECAIEIQKLLSDNAITLPADQVLAHRIGIHLGDVFISKGDVMGNGVNIAARLQAEAHPWSICISQTVYDVVRRELPIEATYQGLRQLKNIPEPIPIYEIVPVQMGELGTPPAPSTELVPAAASETSVLLQRAIAHLAADPDALRIKKLLYCLSEQKWEKSDLILQQVPWPQLVEAVVQKTTTLARLKSLLGRVVRSINKQTEYTLIAQKVISQLSPLYPDHHETTQGFAVSVTNPQVDILPSPAAKTAKGHSEGQRRRTTELSAASPNPVDAAPEVYHTIAQQLAQHEQATRIQKLIFATSQGYWENDPQVLAAADLPALIQQLRQQNTTFDHLALNLYGIVKTLNRQAEYVLVAEAILSALGVLYPQSQLPPDLPHRHYEATEVLSTPPSDLAGSLADAGLDPPPESAGYGVANLVYDRFALREEVVRNTNPLRAKIVITSMLYQKFTGSGEDWLTLKEKNLDTLLYDLFCHCEAYDEMRDRLCIAARFLDEPDLNEQTAEAICAAMKPFYVHIHPNADRMRIFEAILQGKPY